MGGVHRRRRRHGGAGGHPKRKTVIETRGRATGGKSVVRAGVDCQRRNCKETKTISEIITIIVVFLHCLYKLFARYTH